MQQRFIRRTAKGLQNLGVIIDLKKVGLVERGLFVAGGGYTQTERFSRQQDAEIAARGTRPPAAVEFRARFR